MKMTVFWDVAIITLMMKAVNLYQTTRRNIPEDSHLQFILYLGT
jgi:hypothetical protein